MANATLKEALVVEIVGRWMTGHVECLLSGNWVAASRDVSSVFFDWCVAFASRPAPIFGYGQFRFSCRRTLSRTWQRASANAAAFRLGVGGANVSMGSLDVSAFKRNEFSYALRICFLLSPIQYRSLSHRFVEAGEGKLATLV